MKQYFASHVCTRNMGLDILCTNIAPPNKNRVKYQDYIRGITFRDTELFTIPSNLDI